MITTTLEWPLIVAALFPWTCVTAAALITPRVTRPDLFFSVTIKPTFRVSPEAGRILRRYNRIVFLAAALSLLPIAAFKLSPSLFLIGLLGPVLVEMAGWFVAFLIARRQTMPFHTEPTLQREAELTPRQVSVPGGWLAQAGPFLILAIAALCLWMNWDRIPPRIVIHWNMAGRPDGWATKGLLSVFGGDAIGALTCLFLAAIWYAILSGVRRIHSGGEAGNREARFVRVMSYLLLGLEYWMGLLMGFLSLAALRTNAESPLPGLWTILAGQAILVGSIFFVIYRMGQGGSHLKATGESARPDADALPVGDRTPDGCWKLGMIYFNRNDSAIFVEKRFGVGWTLNFGNPRSWFVLGGILLFILALMSLSLMIAHNGRR